MGEGDTVSHGPVRYGARRVGVGRPPGLVTYQDITSRTSGKNRGVSCQFVMP